VSKVELASRAVRDVRSMQRQDRARVLAALEETLGAATLPPNADVKALSGRAPWRRLRVGEWRVIYRPCTADEPGDVLVARVVNRRDLDQAVTRL
jgi:mRNA-degrading endonuclease RelE of RelBE toxin-antitoxin system